MTAQEKCVDLLRHILVKLGHTDAGQVKAEKTVGILLIETDGQGDKAKLTALFTLAALLCQCKDIDVFLGSQNDRAYIYIDPPTPFSTSAEEDWEEVFFAIVDMERNAGL